ncbi:S8 family peptidase [Sutterella sp.]|uniref:S8 family peptidase n=1 Tax=Sutterella sp. TaxID=1981025 RepID=UPI0026DFF9BB|nr:S8 family peptidase [Sutterella sp.]MDO5530773.1 S8 family peptidase [Sutterella sp.]
MISIPPPGNEPVVGVIDTQFSTNVYFRDWVEYHRLVDPAITLTEKDYQHGTEVTSIIVDGPAGNPGREDGCGRFRVRHFGVGYASPMSSFALMKMVRDIVRTNTDIRVWNISLGSREEIRDFFISPEGALLDALQAEFNVIFIVAGTNKPATGSDLPMKIGAPADSINAITVNATDLAGNPASYTRTGPVLHYFTKPDVACFGGDGLRPETKVQICSGQGARFVSGTSYAAPWITRKIAYMIHVLGFSRETAKALLIDSAEGWVPENSRNTAELGHGVVPAHIGSIISCEPSEIRFVIQGKVLNYRTFRHDLPVPRDKFNRFNWNMRATLCYFPPCLREQGVDYTLTELGLRFGRIMENGEIEQPSSLGNAGEKISEKTARRSDGKWNNTKVIKKIISKGLKNYRDLYGFGVISNNRLKPLRENALPFSIVVTLRNRDGQNRIADFMQMYQANGWFVEQVDHVSLENMSRIASEELEFS